MTISKIIIIIVINNTVNEFISEILGVPKIFLIVKKRFLNTQYMQAAASPAISWTGRPEPELTEEELTRRAWSEV